MPGIKKETMGGDDDDENVSSPPLPLAHYERKDTDTAEDMYGRGYDNDDIDDVGGHRLRLETGGNVQHTFKIAIGKFIVGDEGYNDNANSGMFN